MRILFVTPYTPSRIRVRPYNILRALQARGHDVTLATIVADGDEAVQAEALREAGFGVVAAPLPPWRPFWNCLRALPTAEPLQAAYCWEPTLAARLAAAADGDYDVIHVEHLRGARYGLALLDGAANAPVVWDSVDCISLLFELAADQSTGRLSRWLTRFDLPRTRRYEGRLVDAFDHVLVTSARDREALLALAPATASPAVSVLTNGVDLDYFHPGPEAARQDDTLIFSGKMSYHANVTMARYLVEDVLPLVQAERPTARLLVVGKDPTPAVRALAAAPGVTVTGAVPDLRAYLQQAAVAVAPVVYGVGIQNKILEAMACATPVVTTPQAAQSLTAAPADALRIGRDAPELAREILHLLNNAAARRAVGEAGRAYVEAHHDWQQIAESLEEIYRGVILRSAVIHV